MLLCPAPTPWSRLLYLIYPAVRRRQYCQSARCLRAPLDLAIPHQQLAVPPRPHRHSHEHVLALEGFHHLHALHRQLSFPALRVPDREYRRARGEIESGPVPLDSMGFTYVRLFTLPQRNSAGDSLRSGPPNFDVFEIEPAGRELPDATLRRHTRDRRELRMWGRTRRSRPVLRLTRNRDRDLPMIDPHRQVRHQRALDIPHHLLRSQLCRRQHVDLLHRPTVALDDLGGYHSRKRKDELLSTLDG